MVAPWFSGRGGRPSAYFHGRALPLAQAGCQYSIDMTTLKFLGLFSFPALLAFNALAAEPDLILHHGKIVTVDEKFSVREAMAVQSNRITQVGANDPVLKTKGPSTILVDLKGRMVLPGLLDSHTHPLGAAMTEFEHPIPSMESISDVLDYLHGRAEAQPEGQWIVLQQVFITRL